MDDQDKALNQEVEAETTPPTTPVEEQTTEVEADATEETQESPKKKGAEKRIRELNDKVHSLTDKIAELTKPNRPNEQQLPQFMPQIDQRPLVGADESIDGEELERRLRAREAEIIRRSDAMAEIRSNQAITIDRINRETEEVEKKYSELNPDSDSFDQELSDTIYEAVEAKVKAEPSTSVKKFVDRQMKLYRRGVSKEAEEEAEAVRKQANQTAVKPSQAKPIEKDFSELSLAEMEAKLGVVDA